MFLVSQTSNRPVLACSSADVETPTQVLSSSQCSVCGWKHRSKKEEEKEEPPPKKKEKRKTRPP